MEYIIIMPAYNEAARIEYTLDSIVKQTYLPKKLIVVNDGSTDDTPAIVKTFAQKYPWIQLVNNQVKPKHAPGAKIVRAFYIGFETIKEDFDFIVKLDADLKLPEQYFERVSEIFKNNSKVGIAGGIVGMEKDGKWVYESLADKDHVRGAYKSYRKGCFEDIGGLKPSVGWDTVDELLALYHGWEIKTDENLKILHDRVTGRETGSVKVREKVGWAMYRMRYGFWITLISAMKAAYLHKPYGLTGLAVMLGFIKARLRKDEFMVTKEEGKFIRRFRWTRMKKKLINVRR